MGSTTLWTGTVAVAGELEEDGRSTLTEDERDRGCYSYMFQRRNPNMNVLSGRTYHVFSRVKLLLKTTANHLNPLPTL